MKSKRINFFDLQTALTYIRTKTKIPMQYWKKESEVLDALLNQRRISEWF